MVKGVQFELAILERNRKREFKKEKSNSKRRPIEGLLFEWGNEVAWFSFSSAEGWFKGVNLAPKEKVLAEPGDEMQFLQHCCGCKGFRLLLPQRRKNAKVRLLINKLFYKYTVQPRFARRTIYKAQ